MSIDLVTQKAKIGGTLVCLGYIVRPGETLSQPQTKKKITIFFKIIFNICAQGVRRGCLVSWSECMFDSQASPWLLDPDSAL